MKWGGSDENTLADCTATFEDKDETGV